jgi:beta-ureidopropionase
MNKFNIGLVQLSLKCDPEQDPLEIRDVMNNAYGEYVSKAAAQNVKVISFPEICNQAWFSSNPTVDLKWFKAAEPVPGGASIELMQSFAKKHEMVIVMPVFEKEETGIYYNTAAVIDADGKYLGKYRKTHIPLHNTAARGIEKNYFRPSNLGWPVFQTAYCKVGVNICYDTRFDEGWRALALNGADLVMCPFAVHDKMIQPKAWDWVPRAMALNNGLYVGYCNRVGEDPWREGLSFYGKSQFIDPNGELLAQAGGNDELVVAEMDLEYIFKLRNISPMLRDRRPDQYSILTE